MDDAAARQVAPEATLPAGPPSPPREQGFEWFAQPNRMLRECAARYGDRFTLRVPVMGQSVVVHDPAAVRAVFAARPDELVAGPTRGFLRDVLGERSLFLLDGDEHLAQRRLLLEAFRAPRLHESGPMIQAVAREASARWPTGQRFRLLPALLEVSLEVILRVVFGEALESDRHRRIKSEAARALDALSTRASAEAAEGSPTLDRFRQATDALESLFEEERQARRRGAPGGGVLALMIGAADADGTPLFSAADLRDQLLTLLLAGHETTAAALAWALVLLDEHPAELGRLRDALRPLGPDPAAEAVSELPYLDAVVNEVQRLRPVVPVVSREARCPTEVDGTRIPEGVRVSPCVYLAHHRPDRFADPERFMPERFLDARYGPHEYFPFGGGRRRCVGMRLALYEMKLVLAELIQRFDFAAVPRQPLRPVRKGLVVAPSEHAPFILNRRLQA